MTEIKRQTPDTADLELFRETEALTPETQFNPSQSELRSLLGIGRRSLQSRLEQFDDQTILLVTSTFVLAEMERHGLTKPSPGAANFSYSGYRSAHMALIADLKQDLADRSPRLDESDQSSTEHDAISEFDRIGESRSAGRLYVERQRIEMKLAVFETCLLLASIKQDKPFILELAAALAFHPRLGGLRSESFRQLITTLNSLYRKLPEGYQRDQLPWFGAPMPYATLYRENRNVPIELMKLLDQNPGRMYNCRFLLNKLAGSDVLKSTNSRERDSLILASRLLQGLGLIQKHTTEYFQRDDGRSERDEIWSSQLAPAIRTHILNPRLLVLERASENNGSVLQVELYTRSSSRSSQASALSERTIQQAVADLESMGFVETRTLAMRGAPIQISLTEAGTDLIRPWTAAPFGKPLLDAAGLQRLWQICE